MLKRQSGFALIPIIVGVLILLGILGVVYFKVLNKEEDSLLKEEYSNPFEEEAQYQNPFSESSEESYTNPFDTLE